MVGVEEEEGVERLGGDLLLLVDVFAIPEHHLEKIGDIAGPGDGGDEVLTLPGAVGPGDEDGELGDQPKTVAFHRLGVVRVEVVGIVSAQCGDRRTEDLHRVCIGWHRLEHIADGLIDVVMLVNLGDEGFQLRQRWQLAVEKKVRHLEEGGVCGKILDGVAVVEESTRLPVDKCEVAAGLGGVPQAPIQGDSTGLGPQGRDVDGFLTHTPGLHWERDLLFAKSEDGFGHDAPSYRFVPHHQRFSRSG